MGSLLHHGPSHANAGLPQAQAAGPLATKPGGEAAWHQLTPAQQQILSPLHERWATMDDTSRDKWLGVAARYPRLGQAEQARIRERMAQWSGIPAVERGEARLRFQQSRQLTPDERHKQWEAYQALSPEDRNDLQRQALRRSKPVFLSDAAMGPREAKQVFTAKRSLADQGAHKTNLVPTPNGNATAAAVVAPTVVKAGPGATTTLVNQRPTPPLHQQSGLPKIAATQGFVDPVTLLPQRGAQGVGMTAPAASSPTTR
jgi:hypothetical protein